MSKDGETILGVIQGLKISPIQRSNERYKLALAQYAGAYTAFLDEPANTLNEALIRLRLESNVKILDQMDLRFYRYIVGYKVYEKYNPVYFE